MVFLQHMYAHILKWAHDNSHTHQPCHVTPPALILAVACTPCIATYLQVGQVEKGGHLSAVCTHLVVGDDGHTHRFDERDVCLSKCRVKCLWRLVQAG